MEPTAIRVDNSRGFDEAASTDDAVRMRFRIESDLLQLIAHRIPESASLEYKAELPLDTKSERVEALKDLTGMANGGGGTIVLWNGRVRRQ